MPAMNYHRAMSLRIQAVALAAVSFAMPAVSAEVELSKHDNRVVITADREPFAEYLTNSNGKPVVWPIFGPAGQLMTRAYPMQRDVAGESKDHPHQRSLWFTHGDVNGVDFWSEGPAAGKQIHREFVEVSSGDVGKLTTRNDWVTPNRETLLEDTRTISFRASDSARYIDFDMRLTATADSVKLGDTKEGTFGIRIADSMRQDATPPGEIVNSEGIRDKEAWGKSAAWVDYHGPVTGKVAGIAILNHPTSFRFPTFWHVRDYGLFAANPFGIREFQERPDADGSHTLRRGESIEFHFRVIFHEGNEVQGRVSEEFAKYAGQVLPPG
jgi:hypothetical protein